jgi:hypothetical protein
LFAVGESTGRVRPAPACYFLTAGVDANIVRTLGGISG